MTYRPPLDLAHPRVVDPGAPPPCGDGDGDDDQPPSPPPIPSRTTG